MKHIPISVALIALVVAAPAGASSDGTPGPSSTGTFNVSASIGAPIVDNVQIFGLDDFTFSGNEGDTISSQSKPFCMIRTLEGGPVHVTISSFDSADAGIFKIKTPGGAEEIQMNVSITDAVGTSFPMTEGIPSLGIDAPGSCTDADGDLGRASMDISLLNTSGANQGNYSNSFLITVAPD